MTEILIFFLLLKVMLLCIGVCERATRNLPETLSFFLTQKFFFLSFQLIRRHLIVLVTS